MTGQSDARDPVARRALTSLPRAERSHETRQPSARAVLAVASIIAVAFMGSVIVTPLYSLYQRKFGFSEITLTLIYAVYVVGNVVALLLFGQISDQLGRKPVALPALALAAMSALLFLFAHSTLWLFLGRLSIGLAVGILSGTGTAWLAEQYGGSGRSRATLTAATANLSGIAIGPLVGGLLAQYAPAPLKLPFLAYMLTLAIVAVAIACTKETRQQRIHKLTDLRVHPRLGVPRDRIGSFTAPSVTGFVTFAVGGLYFALIPSILIQDLHVRNVAVGGLVVFELGLFAASFIVLGRRLRPVTAMSGGLVLLLPAVALVVSAQALHSMPLLLIATAFAGATMALGYRGSLEMINEIAPDDRRAEVVSSYLIACFVGNSIPVIGVGVLSRFTDPFIASVVFACTIATLSIAALVWRKRDVRPRKPADNRATVG
ncbi:MAG: MFS transporter [Pseudonocardiales bacterium]|nr:MAG: MFS transporter [Pseudonocardiales bacterium]